MRRGSLLRALFLALLFSAAGRANANPVEARRLWEEAKRLEAHPWPAKLRAYRAVMAEATPSDRTYVKALRAAARVARKAGLSHGAAAFEAWAARTGPKRDPGRLAAALARAKELRAEGDLHAAAPLLEALAETARTPAARVADTALALLAEDAFDRADPETLEALARRMERDGAAPHVRLTTWGDVGVLRLAAGDEAGARRALARAERTYREGTASGEKEAVASAKAWLDLALRARIRAAD
jgi:predicted transcriptional regulator